jgi:hypothetical protein
LIQTIEKKISFEIESFGKIYNNNFTDILTSSLIQTLCFQIVGIIKLWFACICKLSYNNQCIRIHLFIHYPSCTDSIKHGLHVPCNIVVINASGGSFCFQIFILHNSSCQVPCDSSKQLSLTLLQCCYIFLVLRDHWCHQNKVFRIVYHSSRC